MHKNELFPLVVCSFAKIVHNVVSCSREVLHYESFTLF